MTRIQKFLGGLLIVQLALIGLTFWPRSTSSAGQGPALFPDFAADQVQRITLETADKRLTLERHETGWVLPDYGDYPAQDSALQSLFERLQGLTTGRLVAQETGSHFRLQVADTQFARRVSWETQDGKSYTLYVGTAVGSGAHVRRGDQVAVYQADNFSVWSLNPDPASWIDTAYLTLNVDKLTEVILKNAKDEVRLVHDIDLWRIPNRELPRLPDQAKISGWVTTLATLHLSAPLGTQPDPAYQLETPQAIVTFKTITETVTLSIGAAYQGGYVAKASNSPYYVRIATYTAESILNKTVEDFLVDATPTPEATLPPEATPTPETSATPTPEASATPTP